MSTEGAKQPVVAEVATTLIKACYDEANRIENHCSDGAARRAGQHLYEAARDAEFRLAAAADDSAKAPPADKTAFDSSAWLAELEAVRRREEWARSRAASGDGVKYTIASAKAEMVNEIIAMWRRHSANEKLSRRLG